MVFINPQREPFNTIFSVNPLAGNLTEATFCGCGEVNPLKKDPLLQTIGVGTRVLINGGIGYVLSKGTLWSQNRPNLSGFADMKQMIPEYMGGFMTSYGPEVITSWAVPIPILNESILETSMMLDENLTLPIVNVHGRMGMGETRFSDVWIKKGYFVKFNKNQCLKNNTNKTNQKCEECLIEEICPTNTFNLEKGIDPKKCFHCGTCVTFCPSKAFSSKMGTIKCQNREIPIVLRHSDRVSANKQTIKLKNMLIKGEFELTEALDVI